MTPTADGKGLLMSDGNALYSFQCISDTNCFWTTTDIRLKIERTDHIMLTVPAALVDECMCDHGFYGETCESKIY